MSEGTTRAEAAAHILARETGRRMRRIQARIDDIGEQVEVRFGGTDLALEGLVNTDEALGERIASVSEDVVGVQREVLGELRVTDAQVAGIASDVAIIAGRVSANDAIDAAQDAELTGLTGRVEGLETRAPVPGPAGPKGDKGPAGPSGRIAYGGGGGSATIQSAGTVVANRPVINFVSGATVTDNSADNRVDVTVSGGGGGVTSLAGSNGITVSAATGAVTAGATFASPASLAVSSTVVTGSASSFANSAHVHAMPGSAVAGASAVADTAAAGSASTLALSDHKHSREAFGTTITASTIGGTAAAGTSTTIVREDHKHAFPAGAAPTALTVSSTQATGSSASPALADHVHAMPGSDTPGASAVADSAAAGSATSLALSDHRHGREAFGTPVVVSGQTTALATGSLTTLARADHVHTVSNVPVLLASTTLTSVTATITITSIPQTFTNLVIWMSVSSAYSSPSVGVYVRANNDTGSNYYNSSTAYTGFPLFSIVAATNFRLGNSLVRMNISDYSSTTSYKYADHFLVYNSSASTVNLGYNINHSMWNNVNAITRIDMVQDVGANFTVGSKVMIYGLP